MRWVKLALTVVIFGYGWLAGASGIYLVLAGKISLYVFPFAQWVEVAPYWNLNRLMRIYVIGSAVAPLVLIALISGVRYRNLRKLPDRPLYGATGWAERDQMERARLTVRRWN